MSGRLKPAAIKIVFGSGALFITLFIGANAYEIVFNQDIPFANSVVKYSAQTPISNLISTLSIKQGASQNSNTSTLTNLNSLVIPGIRVHIQLEEARKVGSSWYTRPGFGNYINLNTNGQGTFIDYLIYTTQSWNGIPNPRQIDVGMAATLDYGNNSTMQFKATAKETAAVSTPPIIATSEARQIILLVEDAAQDSYHYFTLAQEQ